MHGTYVLKSDRPEDCPFFFAGRNSISFSFFGWV